MRTRIAEEHPLRLRIVSHHASNVTQIVDRRFYPHAHFRVDDRDLLVPIFLRVAHGVDALDAALFFAFVARLQEHTVTAEACYLCGRTLKIKSVRVSSSQTVCLERTAGSQQQFASHLLGVTSQVQSQLNVVQA